jgi:hypothetical protein
MPASETITVALEGPDTSLSSFSGVVSALDGLLKALNTEVAAQSSVVWEVESLEVGSATATVRGRIVAGDPDGVARISAAYEAIGDALERRAQVPYSVRVQRQVLALTNVLNDHVLALRLETANRDYTILREGQPQEARPQPLVTLGAVEGRIQALSNRRSLRFTLYDTLDDHAVACYLTPGEEGMIRMLWGLRVIVEGDVTRDPLSGRPTAIRQITDVQALPEHNPGDWREAVGALADAWDGEAAEDAVRRMRDAW